MLRGTKRLVRLALRRDRITLSITLALVIVMVVSSVPALESTYGDYVSQLSYVTSSVSSAVGRIFQGVINGVNLGTILTAETFVTASIIMSVMSIFIISRHTRHNEEIGAAELIGSMNVGRNSPLTAALVVAIGANLLAGLVIFAFLSMQDSLEVMGSFIFVASLVLCGLFFAGVSAITVQLSDYRRGSNMMAIGVLMVAFIIRAVGDVLGSINPDGLGVTSSWLSWLSPLGWANQSLPYSENRMMPLVMLFLGFVVCIVVAYWLLNKRDLGSSILATKPGKDRANEKLLARFGLTLKIQKASLFSWTAGGALMGGMMGAVITDFKDAFNENEQLREFVTREGMGASLDETLIAAMLPTFGAILAGYVVLALSKVHDEEAKGRIESLMSASLSRSKWLITHIFVVILGIFTLLGALGLVAAIGYSLAADERLVTFLDIFLAGVVSLPAMVLFASIICFVFAWAGRYVRSFAWTFFAYCALISSFAGIFDWPQWTSNFSPFTHTPLYPSDSFTFMPILTMLAIAVIMLGLSLVFFRRRDLALK